MSNKMKILNCPQGSLEWNTERSISFCASEAAAMLGLDPNKSRAELLLEKALGITKDTPEYTEKLFGMGHAAEARARDEYIARTRQQLFPIVCVKEIEL